MRNYKSLSNEALPDYMPAFEGSGIAELIGIYENKKGGAEDAVVIGSDGLLVLGKESSEVLYGNIADTTIGGEPGFEKLEADRIVVTLKDGQVVEVPVRGGEGRFRDVYEFTTFLRRCIWYAQHDDE